MKNKKTNRIKINLALFLCVLCFFSSMPAFAEEIKDNDHEYAKAGQWEVTGTYSGHWASDIIAQDTQITLGYFIWKNWAPVIGLGGYFDSYYRIVSNFQFNSHLGLAYVFQVAGHLYFSPQPFLSFDLIRYSFNQVDDAGNTSVGEYRQGYLKLQIDFIFKYHFDQFLLNLAIRPGYDCDLVNAYCGADGGYFSTSVGFSVLF